MKTIRHFVITGRVQGVGFRFYTQRKAREFGVTGWVRNRRDGSVEAMVQGEPDRVESMTAWIRHWPPSAAVIEVQIADGTGDYATIDKSPSDQTREEAF